MNPLFVSIFMDCIKVDLVRIRAELMHVQRRLMLSC